MKKSLRTYAEQLVSSNCMKKEYKTKLFAYLYSVGHGFWFFAIKYTLNHFNLVSGVIYIINTVSATHSDSL